MLNKRKKCLVFVLNCYIVEKDDVGHLFLGMESHSRSVDTHYHLILNHSYTLPILLKGAGAVHSADHTHARVMAVFNYIHASVDFLLFNALNC